MGNMNKNRLKHTKAEYLRLFTHPNHLNPPTANGGGAEVILFPNGAREIWVESPDHLGFRISVSNGPAGLSLRISSFVGTPAISVTGNLAPDSKPAGMQDFRHIEICQYRQDERSQQHKQWYAGNGPHPDEVA